MRSALEKANESTNIWRRVGAVIVKDGAVILQASNQHQPLPHSNFTDGDPRNNANRGTTIETSTDMHAEARLIAQAARKGLGLKGVKMYVTTFPCPVCAKLIAHSGITTVYYVVGYAMLDGEEVLRANHVQLVRITGGDMDDPTAEVWVPYPKKPGE